MYKTLTQVAYVGSFLSNNNFWVAYEIRLKSSKRVPSLILQQLLKMHWACIWGVLVLNLRQRWGTSSTKNVIHLTKIVGLFYSTRAKIFNYHFSQISLQPWSWPSSCWPSSWAPPTPSPSTTSSSKSGNRGSFTTVSFIAGTSTYIRLKLHLHKLVRWFWGMQFCTYFFCLCLALPLVLSSTRNCDQIHNTNSFTFIRKDSVSLLKILFQQIYNYKYLQLIQARMIKKSCLKCQTKLAWLMKKCYKVLITFCIPLSPLILTYLVTCKAASKKKVFLK